jgi:hypothetical protein
MSRFFLGLVLQKKGRSQLGNDHEITCLVHLDARWQGTMPVQYFFKLQIEFLNLNPAFQTKIMAKK